MKNQLNFKLIDGEFELEDAADVLRTLIQAKINHHEKQKFSLEERFGVDHLNCALRVKELRNSLEEVEEFLAQSKLQGKKLAINSDVAITVKATTPSHAK